MIADNYATHKHPKVQEWLEKHPRFTMHFTPTSASWLNMGERFFRDISESRLRRGVFTSVHELVCALADVFDALTSRRPYKAPWSTERAVMQIRRQAGSQFDPVMTEASLEVIQQRETVSLVQWSESMSVGNLHIDEQHRVAPKRSCPIQ